MGDARSRAELEIYSSGRSRHGSCVILTQRGIAALALAPQILHTGPR